MFNYLDPRVGDLVYEPYTPSRAGKIIKVEKKIERTILKEFMPDVSPTIKHVITVLFLNGSTKSYDSIHLQPFDRLVEDHIRKAKKFSDVRCRLLKL